MKKIDLEILDIALSGSSSGAYALVLGEVNGTRKLPIVIGGAEAQSIAIELENMRPSRPLTHDLMKNTISAFGMEVTEVFIHKMVEGIFYAQLTITDGIREEHIDSRSSDAVAIAVRFGCPIRCSSQVMEEAGLDLMIPKRMWQTWRSLRFRTLLHVKNPWKICSAGWMKPLPPRITNSPRS